MIAWDIGEYLYYNSLLTVMEFEINLVFLNKLYCYMTKKSRQKLNYLEDEKSFWSQTKSIFHIFKGLSFAKNCLRPDCAPLKQQLQQRRVTFHASGHIPWYVF